MLASCHEDKLTKNTRIYQPRDGKSAYARVAGTNRQAFKGGHSEQRQKKRGGQRKGHERKADKEAGQAAEKVVYSRRTRGRGRKRFITRKKKKNGGERERDEVRVWYLAESKTPPLPPMG